MSHSRQTQHLRSLSIAALLSLAVAQGAGAGEVAWTGAADVSISASQLRKTGTNEAWDAGIASLNVAKTGYGWVELTATETDTARMAGLSHGDENSGFADIDFAISLGADAELRVYEAGAEVGSFGRYATGDRLRVEVVHGVVHYRRNGRVFYTSSASPRYPLRFDSSFFTPGATLAGVAMGSFVWSNEVGVTIAGDGLTKTRRSAAFDSGASSATTLDGGDGFLEFSPGAIGGSRVIGLGTGDADASAADVELGVHLRADGGFGIVEGGRSLGDFGLYEARDRFRIEIRSRAVHYLHNGTVFYTSDAVPPYPLRVDTSFETAGAGVDGVVFEALLWDDPAGVEISGNTLRKATPEEEWNAGASATDRLAPRTRGDSADGFVETVALETDTRRAFGLRSPKQAGATGTLAAIDFALLLRETGTLEIYELGAPKAEVGSYEHGDRLRVEVHFGSVRYLKNGKVLGESASPAAFPLHPAAALHTPGATLADVTFGDLVWTERRGVIALGTGLGKTAGSTAWGDATAVSTVALEEGEVALVASDNQTHRLLGLSRTDRAPGSADFDFVLYLLPAELQIYEAGVYRGSFGSYVAGDRFRLVVEAGVVRYFKNDKLLYTSPSAPQTPLRVDALFYEPDSTLLGVKLGGVVVPAATLFGGSQHPEGLRKMGCIDDVVLTDTNLDGVQTVLACLTISAGPAVAVLPGADVLFHAGTSVSLKGGFSVKNGAVFRVRVGDVPLEAPTFSPPGGTYNTGPTVTVSVPTGATVRFTTDGTEPTEASAVYTAPIAVTSSLTLKAKAFRAGFNPSDTTSAAYTLNPGCVNDVTLADVDLGGVQTFLACHTITAGPAVTVLSGAQVLFHAGDSVSLEVGFSVDVGAVFEAEVGNLPQTVMPPTITPAGGTYTSEQTVTIGVPTDSTVHFTTDGSEPTEASTLYTAPFTVTSSLTLKAKAFRAGFAPSNTASESYTLKVPTPTATPPGGSFGDSLVVTLDCSCPGAAIHYTTDGSTPTLASLSVAPGGNVTVDQTLTLTFAAFRTGWTTSDVVAESYTGTVDPPTISPPGGTYLSEQTVTIGVPAGATVHFTTDGSEPTEASTLYTAPFTVSQSLTLKARAFQSGSTPSNTVSESYTLKVPTPMATPPGGSFGVSLDVTLDCSCPPGSTIHYTTDGSAPTELSLGILPGETVTVDQTLTLTFAAFRAGWTPSDPASESYSKIEGAVEWTNAVGVTATGNDLVKTDATSAWTAGAASTGVVGTGYGWVEFTATETDTFRLCGLSHGDSDAGDSDVDFAIRLHAGGFAEVLESGFLRGSFDSYAPGDRFRVEVRHGEVRYLKNGVPFFTGITPARYPLRVDSSLFTPGATLTDVRMGTHVWSNAIGVTVSGGALAKPSGTAGFNAGATSAMALEGGDGFLELRPGSTDSNRVIGLGNGDTDQSETDIEFGVHLLADGTFEILESGVPVTSPAAYLADDRLRVQLRAGTVEYLHNGTLVHTSTAAPAYPLLVDSAFDSVGGSIADVVFERLLWTNEVGVEVDGNSLSKTAGAGWNASAASTNTLAAGDGFVEAIALETETRRAFGLGTGAPATTFSEIDFAILLSESGTVELYELGTFLGDFGPYTHGDRLRVELHLGEVRYLNNGAVLHTSAAAPAFPLHADTALFTPGATLTDVVLGDLVWTAGVGTVALGSGLAKTAGTTAWDAGAASTAAIQEGSLDFIASDRESDRLVGLTGADTAADRTDVDFGIQLGSTGSRVAQVWESGSFVTTLGSYLPGDRFRIEVAGGTVTYLHNGTPLYTSLVSPAPPLRAGSSFRTPGSSVLDVRVSGTGAYTVEAPSILLPAGTYFAEQAAAIEGSAPSTVRFTVDGSDPTVTSPVYTGPVAIPQSLTLRARAFRPGWTPSPIASASYTLSLPAPSATPPGGTLFAPKDVTLDCSCPAATLIHYTTDGGDPTAASPSVSPGGTVLVSTDLTLTFRAFRAGWTTSDPVAESYTVLPAPAESTTLVGVVQLEDGSPAAGARVTADHVAGRFDLTGSDGAFELAGLNVAGLDTLAVTAELSAASGTLLGFASGVAPVVGGITDAGTIVLKAPCDAFFSPLPFVVDGSTLSSLSADTMAVADLGAGAELFVGGRFDFGGAGSLGRIARWGSRGWEEVGGGIGGGETQASVRALAAFDDGSGPALFAGGTFALAGGAPAANLARWDGESWQEAAGGTGAGVTGLAVFDDGSGPALYAAGAFTSVDTRTDWAGRDLSTAAGRVARWDGQLWSEVGGGLPVATTLSVLDDGSGPALFAWSDEEIWKLVAGSWQPLPDPLAGEPLGSISALTSANDGGGPALYAAGQRIGVRKLVGAGWQTLLPGSGFDSDYDLVGFADGAGSVLYASGTFHELSPSTPRHLRSWNGSAWSSSLGETPPGLFVPAGFQPQPALLRPTPFAEWNGSAWVPLQTGIDTAGSVTSVAVVSEAGGASSVLFAGATEAGGLALGGGIGRWNGAAVTAAGTGLTGGGSKVVQASDGLARHIYGLTEASGEVGEWNGSGWTLLGSAIGTPIRDVAWVDLGGGAELYAAGDGLFRWDGAAWISLGGPNAILDIEGFQGELYAGGSFANFAGSRHIVRWDGTTWSPVGVDGVNDTVHTLAVHDGVLQVGGEFTRTESGAALKTRLALAAWTGTTWVGGHGSNCGYARNRFLGPSATSVQTGTVFALATFDDGLTESFLIGGDYASKCNGTSGSSIFGSVLPYTNLNLGTGVDGPAVRALATGPWEGAPAVVVGGDFGAAGGVPSGRLAIWHRSPTWGSCSPKGQPPVIEITSPPAGPTNQAIVGLAGSLGEPATLTLNGTPVVVQSDLTFTVSGVALNEGHNALFFEAVDRSGQRGSLRFELVRDSAPPTVAFTAPAPGTTLFAAGAPVDLTLADAGVGVDPATLILEVDGVVQTPASCLVHPDRARCTLNLNPGSPTLRARVSDLAGNPSLPAAITVQVDLSSGSTTTQLTGAVQHGDSTPAAGARVRLLGRPGVEALTAADGSFSIPVSGVTSSAPWTVTAELTQGSTPLFALAQGVVPVPGGTTAAGTLVLGPACDPEFGPQLLSSIGVDGRVRALAVFDDGSGPAVFIGGSSLRVLTGAGTETHHLLRWQGGGAEIVSPGFSNGSGVRALAVFDDGSGPALYVGGDFNFIGGAEVSSLARWDGTAFSDVGGGVACGSSRGLVNALHPFNDGTGPRLFVGGRITHAGGSLAADLVARWNGTTWSSPFAASGPACSSVREVQAFAEYNDGSGNALYAAGRFDTLGTADAKNVAELSPSGDAWLPLGRGAGTLPPNESQVAALAVFQGELYAAGLFAGAGEVTGPVRNVARWNGTRWASAAGGLDVSFNSGGFPKGVQSLGVYDDGSGPALYAAGSFTGETAAAFGSIARFDGTAWAPVGLGISGADPGGMAMLVHGGELIVGGDFDTAGGLGANRISRWNGAGWRPLGTGFDRPVRALAVFDDGTGPALFLGGEFRSVGALALNHLARFDGSAFTPVGGGTSGPVYALETHDDGSGNALYLGGRFSLAGGVPADNVARWNGTAFSPLGSGVRELDGQGVDSATVYALEGHDDGGGNALYVGGDFDQAGTLSATGLARWRAGSWSSWGSGANGTVRALTEATIQGATALYAGGTFTTIGGGPAQQIARWNGSVWEDLGHANPSVEALVAWEPDRLVAGGRFSGHLSIRDGSGWSQPAFRPNGPVLALGVWDDGSGSALYAGGELTEIDASPADIPAPGAARYDGTSWSALGASLGGGDVFAIRPFEDGSGRSLFLGGSFTGVGGASAYAFARWHRPLACGGNAPTLSIDAPSAGGFANRARPELVVSYADVNGDVAPATLAFTDGGTPLAGGCTTGATGATCTPAADLIDGSHTLVATLSDLAGNSGTSAPVTFTVDTVPPVLTISTPLEDEVVVNPQPTVTFQTSDVGTGIVLDSFGIFVTGNSAATILCDLGINGGDCNPTSGDLGDGRWSYLLSTEDLAGNRTQLQRSFVIDTQDPTLSLDAPAAGTATNNSSPAIRLSYGDAGTGIDTATLALTANGAPLAVSCQLGSASAVCFPAAPFALGAVTLDATIADLHGRSASVVGHTFTVSDDFTAPVITLTAPGDDTLTAAASVTVTGSLSETAALTLNGAPVTVAGDLTFSQLFTLGEGLNPLRLVATDPVGNRGEAAVSVRRDTTAPVVTIVAPEEGSSHNLDTQPIQLRWEELGSGVDLDTVEVRIDGSVITASCTPVIDGANCFLATPPSGPVSLQLTLADFLSNPSLPVTVSFTSTAGGADNVPPLIELLDPRPGSTVAVATRSFSGRLSEPATLTLGGAPVTVEPNLTFTTAPQTLSPGANAFQLQATDGASNASTLDFTIHLDATVPDPVIETLVTVSETEIAVHGIGGSAGAVPAPETGAVVVARNLSSGGEGVFAVAGDGSFSGAIAGLPGDLVQLTVRDLGGNESAAIAKTLTGTPGLPPDPATVAPPQDPSLPTDLCASVQFLWTGADRLQFGVQAGALDCERLAVLRGLLLDAAGLPLGGVRVSVDGRPELGLTLSRADGAFDLAVIGGGPVTLLFTKDGYLPSRRTETLVWREWATFPDVVLVQPDSRVTTVDLAAPQPARGSVVTDSDGSRQATLLFEAGTTAHLVLPGGATQSLSTLNVRATEYSQGPRGEESLPAELPPTVAYAYSVELSIDETNGTAAERVELSQPVPFYVENFLNLPVGQNVPTASFDEELGVWLPEDNGRIVKILSETAGRADLDTTGDGVAATGPELDALGITGAERTRLATLYAPGQTLWRVPVSHFTPFAMGPPAGVSRHSLPPVTSLPQVASGSELDDPTVSAFAGLIEVENQILGHSLSLAGSSVGLHYRSDRVPGRKAPFVLTIPLTGETLPPSLAGVELTINIAGQTIRQSFTPQPAEVFTFEWDGNDRFGRPVGGKVPWDAALTYLYPGSYRESDSGNPAWGIVGGVRIQTAPTRNGLRLSRESGGTIGNLQAIEAFGLGGWSLGVHHVLDVDEQTLFFGDGSRWNLGDGRQQPLVLTRVAGTPGVPGSTGDGGPATEARMFLPIGVSVMRDGSLLVTDFGNCRVRKIDPAGIISTVAGSICGDGQARIADDQSATTAQFTWIRKAIEGPDGAIYIVEHLHNRIYRVFNGRIETFAGTGGTGCTGLGGRADLAPINAPRNIAFDSAGNLLVLTAGSCAGLYRIDRKGTLTRLLGAQYEQCESAEENNCPGGFRSPHGLSVAADGSVIFTDYDLVTRRPPEGKTEAPWPVAGVPRELSDFAGNPVDFLAGDGEPASSTTRFRGPGSVASGPDGSIFISDFFNGRIRVIGPDNIINTIAGGGSAFPADGVAGRDAALVAPFGVALDPRGEELYFADHKLHVLFKLGLPAISGTTELFVPSPDGSLLYVFTPEGRHLRTEDALSRETLWTFTYTAYDLPELGDGQTQLLTAAEDAFGNTITVERLADGTPTAIVAPFGQRNALTLNPATGYLRQLSRQIEGNTERVELTTDDSGLLKTLKTPKNQIYTYTFDGDGRLERVNDPENGELVIDRFDTPTGHRVRLTTKENLQSSTEVSTLPDAVIKQRVTLPTGHTVEVERLRDGSFEWLYPDNTEVRVETKPDPRLGAASPIVSRTVLETPVDRLERVVERSRTLAGPGEDFAFNSQTDVVTVNGRTSQSTYDSTTRTVSTLSPEGRTGETVFDTFGRVTEVREPGFLPVNVSYDTRGRLQEVRQGAGQEQRRLAYTYNPEGFLRTVTDPLQRVTTYDYDKVGRVTKTTLPDLREIRYAYDLNGNLTQITPPSRPDHTFDHNDVDQVDRYDPPELETVPMPQTTYAYDLDHRLTTITRPDGQQLHIDYDSGGRVDRLRSPYGITDLVYQPDTGKLASITEPAGASTAFTYDGPWIKEVTVAGPFDATIQLHADRPISGFNATNFWLEKLTINNDPATRIDYEYNDDGQPTRIEDLDVFYDPANGRWLGSHVDQTGNRITRNPFGELERFEAGYLGGGVSGGSPPHVGETLLDISYDRDKLGRIERKTERTRTAVGQPQVTRVFEYEYDDDRGWLTEVRMDGVLVESYAYDANGNRTTWSTDFGSGTATYDDQDRLLRYGQAEFTYTENGELLTKRVGGVTTSYTYDVFSNLRGVRLDNGVQLEYLVDASNRRIATVVDGVVEKRFLYLGGLSPIAELDGAGAVTTQYVYHSRINVPDHFVRAGVVYRVFTDHLGSVRLVVRANDGAVVQRMEYDSFGRVVLDTAPGFQPFGFAGGLYDFRTGLVRFGARDYDAETGRWTSKDPIGFAGGDTSLYGYVFSDPVNLVDPEGLQIAIKNPHDFERNSRIREKVALFFRDIGLHPFVPEIDSFLAGYLPENGPEAQAAFMGSLVGMARVPGPVPRFVYRGGSRTPNNLTPSPKKDVAGPDRGLSTFDTLEGSTKPGNKAQKIDVDKLQCLEAHCSPDGHVALRPRTQAELEEWSATKGTETVHPLTKEVDGAIVETVRRPKN